MINMIHGNCFGSDYNNIDSNEANEVISQAYLDGLAEGREEIAKLKEEVEYWKNEYYYLKANPR